MNPTAQLFRRPLTGPADWAEAADALRVTLPRLFSRCRVRELTTEAVLAGRRAVRYTVDYTLALRSEDAAEPVEFRCRCRGHIVPVGAYALTLTIATSTVARYREDDAVAAILGSASFAPATGIRQPVT